MPTLDSAISAAASALAAERLRVEVAVSNLANADRAGTDEDEREGADELSCKLATENRCKVVFSGWSPKHVWCRNSARTFSRS